MSTSEHGPVRGLVDRVYDAADGDPYNNRLRARLEAAADAHDARVRALVAAAEAYLRVMDIPVVEDIVLWTGRERETRKALRAALDGWKEGQGE